MQIVALASGTGTNFGAICEHIKTGKINAQMLALIVDKPNAKAIQVAFDYGIKCYVVDYKTYKTKLEYEHAILKILQKLKPDLICLAGYMKIVSATILDHYQGRMINIHPSLLPKYPGLDALNQAISNNEEQAGATVHFVDLGMDTGEIILQKSFSIKNMDQKACEASLKVVEHEIYKEAINKLIETKEKNEKSIN